MNGNPVEAMRVEAQRAVPAGEAGDDVDRGEEYVYSTSGCPTCGILLGGSLSEPPTSDDPEALRTQAEQLRGLASALDGGRARVEDIRARLDDLCPVCRATMDPRRARGTPDEVAGRLRTQAGLLEDRATAIERSSLYRP
ncbi:MAG TPA: hypothetical protein VFB58_02570 [Chloroflexota bacterium]|nr:hypothetical protein [Chloroflexota bacterium]